MNKVIKELAKANPPLRGVIDNTDFDDPDKLGNGKEMVDKLSELLCIFRDQMPDLGKNRSDGDDIIGDAYEYLMRNFATESGKSKGQFYTPAEVSRVLAKVVWIENATSTDITRRRYKAKNINDCPTYERFCAKRNSSGNTARQRWSCRNYPI